MGIRMDQPQGLPPEAHSFLATNEIEPKVCPHCKRPYPLERGVIGSYEGMFGTEYPLHKRVLKDGRIAEEFLQATIWSSGPMFFLGLKMSNGTVFEWSDEELEQF